MTIAISAAGVVAWPCDGAPRSDRFEVLIDPGHGGRDVGAPSSVRGVFEKDVNLAIAKTVAEGLKKDGFFSVVMTRRRDRYLSLVDRRRLVTLHAPDLVISIHADSGPPSAQGPSVYVLNEAGEAIVVGRIAAGNEWATTTEDTGYILADLRQRGSMNFAALVARQIVRALGAANARRRPPRTANFALLKSPGVPSILIETGYVTNPQDLERLRDHRGQRRIADAIVLGIVAVARRGAPKSVDPPDVRPR